MMCQKIARVGWSGFGMATGGIHPTHFRSIMAIPPKSHPKEYWEVYCKTADMNMLENEEHSRHRITDGDPDEDDQDQHRTDQTPMSPIPVQRADLPDPIWSNF